MKRAIAWVLLMLLLCSGCTNSLFLQYSINGNAKQTQGVNMNALFFGGDYEGSVSDFFHSTKNGSGSKWRRDTGTSSTVKSANIPLQASGGGSRATSGERAFFLGNVEFKPEQNGLSYEVIEHDNTDFIYFEIIDFIEEKNMFIYAYQTIAENKQGESKLESQLMAYQYDTHIYQIIFKQTSDPNESLSQSMFVQKLPNKTYRTTNHDLVYDNATYSQKPQDSDYFLYFGGKVYYYTWDKNATAANEWYWESQKETDTDAGAYVNAGEIDITNGYMRVYNQIEAEKRREDPTYSGLYSMTVTDVAAAGDDYRDIYMSLAVEYSNLDSSLYLDDVGEDEYTEQVNQNTLNLTLKYSIKELRDTNISSTRFVNQWQKIDEETDESDWVPVDQTNLDNPIDEYAAFVDDAGNRYDIYYCDETTGTYDAGKIWDSYLQKSNGESQYGKIEINNEKLAALFDADTSAEDKNGQINSLTEKIFSQLNDNIKQRVIAAGRSAAMPKQVRVMPDDLSAVYSYRIDPVTNREVYYHFSGNVTWVDGEVKKKISAKKEQKVEETEYIYGYLKDGKYSYEYNVTDYFDGEESGKENRKLDGGKQCVKVVEYNGQKVLAFCDPNEIEAPVGLWLNKTSKDLFKELVKQNPDDTDTVIMQNEVEDGSVISPIYDTYANGGSIYFKMPENFKEYPVDMLTKVERENNTGEITQGTEDEEGNKETRQIVTKWYKIASATLAGSVYPIHHTYWKPVTDNDDVEYIGVSDYVGEFKAPDIDCVKFKKRVETTTRKYEVKYAVEKKIAKVENPNYKNFYYSCEVVAPAGQFVRGGVGVNSVKNAMDTSYLYDYDKGTESAYNGQAKVLYASITIDDEENVFYSKSENADFSETANGSLVNTSIAGNAFLRAGAGTQLANGNNGYYRGFVHGGILEVFVKYDQSAVKIYAILSTPMPMVTTQKQKDAEDETAYNALNRVRGYLSSSADKYTTYVDSGSNTKDIIVFSEDSNYTNTVDSQELDISLFVKARSNFQLYNFMGNKELYNKYWWILFPVFIFYRNSWLGQEHITYLQQSGNTIVDSDEKLGLTTKLIESNSFFRRTYQKVDIDGTAYYQVQIPSEELSAEDKRGYNIMSQILTYLSKKSGMSATYSPDKYKDFISVEIDDEGNYTVSIAADRTLQADGSLRSGAVTLGTTNEDKTKPFGTFYTTAMFGIKDNCYCRFNRMWRISDRRYRDSTLTNVFDTEMLTYETDSYKSRYVGARMMLNYVIGCSIGPELSPAETTKQAVYKLIDGSYTSGGTSSYSEDSKIAHLFVNFDTDWDGETKDKRAINAGHVTDVIQTPLKGKDGRPYFAAFSDNGIYFAAAPTEDNGKVWKSDELSINDETEGFHISWVDLAKLSSGFEIDIDDEELSVPPVDNTVGIMTVVVDTPPKLEEDTEAYFYGYAKDPSATLDTVEISSIPFREHTEIEFYDVPKNNTYCIFRVKGNLQPSEYSEDGEYVYDESTFTYLKKYNFSENWTESTLEIESASTENVQYQYAYSEYELGEDIDENAWRKGDVPIADEDGNIQKQTVTFENITRGKTYYIFARYRTREAADKAWSSWSAKECIEKRYIEEGSNPYEDAQNKADYKDMDSSSVTDQLNESGIQMDGDYDYLLESDSPMSCTYAADSIHFVNENMFLISNPDYGIAMVSIDRASTNESITQDKIKITQVASGCYYSAWRIKGESDMYMAIGFDNDGSSYLRGDLPYVGVYKLRLSGENSVETNVVRNTLKNVMSSALKDEMKKIGTSAVALTSGADSIIQNIDYAYESYVKIDAYNKVLRNNGIYSGDTVDRLQMTQMWTKASTMLAARAWKDTEKIANDATASISDLSLYINNRLEQSVNEVMEVVNNDRNNDTAIRNAVLAINAEVRDPDSEFRKKITADLTKMDEWLKTLEALKKISEVAGRTAQAAEGIASQYVSSVTEESDSVRSSYKTMADTAYNNFDANISSLLTYGAEYYRNPISAAGYSEVANNLTDPALLSSFISEQKLAYNVGQTVNGTYQKGFLDALCDVYGSELKFEVGSNYSETIGEIAETLEVLASYRIVEKNLSEQISSMEEKMNDASLKQETKNEIQLELSKATRQSDLLLQTIAVYENRLKAQISPLSRSMIMENFQFHVDYDGTN